MKTFLLSLTLAALAATASAQVFQPVVASNVLLGGIAGAVIGEHNHHQALAGAAIGAAAGYVWSEATAPRAAYYAPAEPVYYTNPGYAVANYAPRATVVMARAPVYCAPTRYYSRPVYYGTRPVYYAPRAVGYRGYDRYGHVYYGRR